MEIEHELEGIKKSWNNSIKPYIESKKDSEALIEIHNLNYLLKSKLDQYSRYSSGVAFIVSSLCLEQNLENNNETSDVAQRFETFLSLLEISVKSENPRLKN
ncbi:hypothetical protein CL617_05870 [archaeon]|nr:hypothetical protein [archaeon]|tara:strand:- start:3239 stop:3544 length:306 start_codon:yes stop_codon:yes gene_type:complete